MADGTIEIDLAINKKHFKSDSEEVKSILRKLGVNAGDGMDKSFNKNADKVKKTASSTERDVKSKLDKTVKTKLEANDAGIKSKAQEAKENVDKIPKSKKTELSVQDNASHTMNKASNEADKTGQHFHRLRDIIHGTFIGGLASNAVSSAFSAISSRFTGIIQEGMHLNAVTAGIERRFRGMGMSSHWTKEYMTQIGYLKSRINATGADVAALQTNVTNWSRIGRRGALQMTQAIGEMGDRTNMTSEGYQRLSMSLMRVGSSGKVSLGTLSRIAKVAPGLYRQLAEGAGVSVSHMKAMLATGKVTTNQFQKWLADSSAKGKKAFKDYAHTQTGATVRMRSAWQKLEAQMTKPLFNMKTSGLNQLADLMRSHAVTSGAKLVGDGIKRIAIFGLQILQAIGRHKADVAGIMTDIVKITAAIAKTVWNDFVSIIGTIGRMFGLVHDNGKKAGSSLHVVKQFLDGIAKNKLAVKSVALLIEMMAAAKLGKTLNKLTGIGSALKGVYKGFRGVEDVSKLSGSEKVFYRLAGAIKHPKDAWKGFLGALSGGKARIAKAITPFKKFASKVKGIFTDLGKKSKNLMQHLFTQKQGSGGLNGLMQSAHSAGGIKGLSTAGKIGFGASAVGIGLDVGSKIVKGIHEKAGSKKQYQDIGSAAGSGIGGAIGLWFGGPAGAAIGAKIGGVVGKWAGGATKKFVSGWNAHKPPKHFWSLENLGYSAHNMWNGFTKGVSNTIKWFKKNWLGLALVLVNPFVGGFKLLYDNNKGFRKWVNGMVKGFKNAWNGLVKWFVNLGKGIKKAWNGLVSFFKRLGSNTKKAFMWAWKKVVQAFKAVIKAVKKVWHVLTGWFKAIGRAETKAFKWAWKKVSGWFKGIVKAVKGVWHVLTGWFGSLSKNTVGAFKSAWKGIVSWFKGLIGGIKRVWDSISGIFGNVKKFMTGKLKVGNIHLAGGTDWRRRYPIPAIVNDGSDSPETNNREGLIDTDGTLKPFPNVRYLKWLLMPGQEVVNARDMAMFGGFRHFAKGTKSFGGGITGMGRGGSSIRSLTRELKDLAKILKQVRKLSRINLKAKGLAKTLKDINRLNRALKSIGKEGIRSNKQFRALSNQLTKLTKQIKASYSAIRKHNFGKLLAKQASAAVSRLKGKGNFARSFRKLAHSFLKSAEKLGSDFKKEWSETWKNADKSFQDWTKQTDRTQSRFNSRFEHGWLSLDKGVSKIFSKFWSTMRTIAGRGINRVISILNSGISKINGVIHSFGGSSRAVSYAGHVHYASGTGVFNNARRPITSPTLAMVNDGNDSPETGNREALWRPSTGYLGVFEGRNVPAMLMPGDEILNASETRALGLTHYASGTGSLKALYELTKKYYKNPNGTLDNMLTTSVGMRGGIHDLARGMAKSVQDQAEDWWKTLWTMVHEKIDSGSASGLLKAVEKYGRGHRYVLGAAGPSTFDCSGLVMYALKKAYGINYPHFSGAQYARTRHISKSEARPGDLVFWGPQHHVGVYAGGNRYYSAQSPSMGIHMNTLSSVVGEGRPLFGRVRGINAEGHKNATVKANTALEKLIRGQVGQGFWKTIQKIADKYGESAYGIAGKPSGDHGHWMAQAHIPRRYWGMLNWIISGESGWNPHARNPSSGTYGLGQMQSYNLHYYRRHGGINNPIAQLMGIMDYIHDRYGSVAHAYAFRKSHGWYANGGFVTEPTDATIGEGNGPEVVLPYGDPSKRERTLQLMQATIAQMQAQDGQSAEVKTDKQVTMNLEATNAAIAEMNSKFDKALQALGIIQGKDTKVYVTNDIDPKKVGTAIYPVIKQMDSSNIRKAGANLSGYQSY